MKQWSTSMLQPRLKNLLAGRPPLSVIYTLNIPSMEIWTFTTIKQLVTRSPNTCASYPNRVEQMFWRIRNCARTSIPHWLRWPRPFWLFQKVALPPKVFFSKTKNVLGLQCASLSSMSATVLLCLKYWYQLFGPLFVVDPDMENLLSSD